MRGSWTFTVILVFSVIGGSLYTGLAAPILAASGTPSAQSWGGAGSPHDLSTPFSVDLNISTSSGPAPLRVNISTAASGGSGPYSLDLCPGILTCTSLSGWSGALEPLIGVTYTTPGRYMVSSTVTDSMGTVSEAVGIILVSRATPLEASILPLPTEGNAPFTVEFAAVVSGGVGPYNLTWNFGDGHQANVSSGEPVNWTYDSTGTYLPKLTVVDAHDTVLKPALTTIDVTPAAAPSQLTVGTYSIPWWVVAATVTVTLAAFVGAGYVVYERRLRDESLALVEALWTEQTVDVELEEKR